jgi:hypothetical protein
MLYNKLNGTTLSSFQLGKNGVKIANSNGHLQVQDTVAGNFLIGASSLVEDSLDIPTAGAIKGYVDQEILLVTGEGGLEGVISDIETLFDAIDLDEDFYLHVLRLQDSDGNAVDGQSVKGTTTFEKATTFSSEIKSSSSNFTITPLESTTGAKDGKVIIAGNFQVDGTTTTINSTTLEVDDKNIVLASGAANAAAANGAGITIDGADATLTYASSGDKFVFNKNVFVNEVQVPTSVTGGAANAGDAVTDATISGGQLVFTKDNFVRTGTSLDKTNQDIYGTKIFKDKLAVGLGTVLSDARLHVLNDTNFGIVLENTSSSGSIYNNLVFKNKAGNQYALSIGQANESSLSVANKFFLFDVTASAVRFVVDASGNMGVGTASPSEKLEVNGKAKASEFISTIATGTAPLTVASTTVVTNLNADKLDGADLETSLTAASDSRVPTSKAVATYAVPVNISPLSAMSFNYGYKTNGTTDKANSFVYVYDNNSTSKKMSLSEIHRPSIYDSVPLGTEQDIIDEIDSEMKMGDFIFEEVQ